MGMGNKSGLAGKLGTLRTGSYVWMPIGKKVVIVGGELVGLELAEFLAERGRDVTVLEESRRVGFGLPLVRRFRVVDVCHELGVALNTEIQDVEIGDRAVSCLNDAGQKRTIPADMVIVAQGATGDEELANQIWADDFDVSIVGDCGGVGYIEGAMRSAALAVQAICKGADNMGRFAGKRVLLTGGASGIGRATADLFVREGATLTFGDIDVKGGKAVAEELGATYVSYDATDPEQATELAASARAGMGALIFS